MLRKWVELQDLQSLMIHQVPAKSWLTEVRPALARPRKNILKRMSDLLENLDVNSAIGREERGGRADSVVTTLFCPSNRKSGSLERLFVRSEKAAAHELVPFRLHTIC